MNKIIDNYGIGVSTAELMDIYQFYSQELEISRKG